MLSRCSALAQTEKAVDELLAIIGQNRVDKDWTRTFEVTQKAPGIGSCLVAIDGNEDPAGGPVDRHKEISSPRLIGHSRQVFHVNLDVSELIRLEPTMLRFLILGLEITKASHDMPAQATIQTLTGHIRVQKLAHHGQ